MEDRTIKIKTEQKTELEVEIKLPHYRKTLGHFYKVYSQDKCISIYTGEEYASIQICSINLAFNGISNEECSSRQYEEAFKKVSDILKSK